MFVQLFKLQVLIVRVFTLTNAMKKKKLETDTTDLDNIYDFWKPRKLVNTCLIYQEPCRPLLF